MKTTDILNQEDIHEVIEFFLSTRKPIEVTTFATRYMPVDFAHEFLLKRLSYQPKDAFRRAVKTFIVSKESLQDKILNYIRSMGSFCAEDLPTVLGRTPNNREIHLTTAFMHTLTPENINNIFVDKQEENI
jgi:hypothetical protein